MAAAKAFVKNTLLKDFELKERTEKKAGSCESKNQFQEYVQKRKLGSIAYETLSKTGPDHLPEFKVAAILNGTVIAEGKGSTKRLAEADAATSALKKLFDRSKDRK